MDETKASRAGGSAAAAAASLDVIKGPWVEQARALVPDDLVVRVSPEGLSKALASEATRQLVAEMMAADDFDPPPTHASLAEELQVKGERRVPLLGDPGLDVRSGSLALAGQTVVIIARFKTGKTTLLLNLARSLADGVPFLGKFAVQDIDGSVGIWNYELPDWQWREWAGECGIRRPERIRLLHLRGYKVNLMRDHDAEWAEEWLREGNVKVWALDTWLAALNSEENDNTGAGDFYRRVQEIARRAGVPTVVWTTQQGTGEGNQARGRARARGATALMDNADVFWHYELHGEERFLKAFGRDVDYPEFSVQFEWQRRALIFGEEKSGHAAETRAAIDAFKPKILDYLTELPSDIDASQRNTGGVGFAVGDTGKQGHASKALSALDAEKKVHHTHGARNAKLWWIGPGSVTRPCTDGDCGRGAAQRVTPKKKAARR